MQVCYSLKRYPYSPLLATKLEICPRNYILRLCAEDKLGPYRSDSYWNRAQLFERNSKLFSTSVLKKTSESFTSG